MCHRVPRVSFVSQCKSTYMFVLEIVSAVSMVLVSLKLGTHAKQYACWEHSV